MIPCRRPPKGWACSRAAGHDGPCAARSTAGYPGEATVEPDDRVPAALMELAGGHGRVLWHKSKPWASASFTGSRDQVAFEFFGAEAVKAGAHMLSVMGEYEFALKGRTVAELELGWNTKLSKPDVRSIAVIELLLVKD